MHQRRKLNWIESYYQALEFFYWEPQHLDRKKLVGSNLNSINKVSDRLRRMEVTLNQNLHQFFLLAPSSLVEKLFTATFETSPAGPFTLHGRDVDADFRLINSVQPDLLFTADGDVVSVEMKITAKCSVSQVLKYALLGLAVEQKFGKRMRHYFLVMGCGEFYKQWPERFPTMNDLRTAIASADLDAFLGRRPSHFRPHLQRLAEIVHETNLAFLNYQTLASMLLQSVPSEADTSEGSKVYRNLLLGILDELNLRQLATCAPGANLME